MIQRSARPKKQLLQRRASLAPLLEMLLDLQTSCRLTASSTNVASAKFTQPFHAAGFAGRFLL
jgi:hypothetical protein